MKRSKDEARAEFKRVRDDDVSDVVCAMVRAAHQQLKLKGISITEIGVMNELSDALTEAVSELLDRRTGTVEMAEFWSQNMCDICGVRVGEWQIRTSDAPGWVAVGKQCRCTRCVVNSSDIPDSVELVHVLDGNVVTAWELRAEDAEAWQAATLQKRAGSSLLEYAELWESERG